jgi:hypothetical protein
MISTLQSKLHLGRTAIVIASASEAIQGTQGARRFLDRRVATLLAMTIPPERSAL